MITNNEILKMIEDYNNSNECIFILNRIMTKIANNNLSIKAKETYNNWVKHLFNLDKN